MSAEHKAIKSSTRCAKTNYALAFVGTLALTSSKVPTTTAFQSPLSSLMRQQQSIHLNVNKHGFNLNHHRCHQNTCRSGRHSNRSGCKLNAIPIPTHQSALFRTTKAKTSTTWNSNSLAERSTKWAFGKRRNSSCAQSGVVSLQSSTMVRIVFL